MQNHYSINVARRTKEGGRFYHLFSTRPESILQKHTAADIFEEMVKRFPSHEGFEVTISYWQASGRDMTQEFWTIVNMSDQSEVSKALEKL
jgi:hypothetical protein